jgi:hypothetical protein
MSGDLTLGYLNRLTKFGGFLAGQLASAVNITGGTISGVTISGGARTGPLPALVGASLAITPSLAGATVLLSAATGSVATLPAATGTGNTYRFVVSVTASSNAHKILAASGSDFLNGIVMGQHTNAVLGFSSAAATNHSIQMPFAGTQPSGGFIGDWFDFTDTSPNVWSVKGMFQSGTTSTTPFSTATT